MSSDAVDPSPVAPVSPAPVKPVSVKLVLLGEAAVGKSSLVQRFVHNEFQENKEPTIGAAFQTQKTRLEDKVIKFEIWDTAGQERFHSLAPMYYRNAQAAVVVYDITHAPSLDKAKSWVKELQRQANPNIVIALTGNKLDLVDGRDQDSDDGSGPTGHGVDTDDDHEDGTAPGEDEEAPITRQVSTEEARSYADESGLLFFETSAKLNHCVQEVFNEIAKKIPVDQIMAPSRGTRSGASGNRGIDLMGESGQGVGVVSAGSCSC